MSDTLLTSLKKKRNNYRLISIAISCILVFGTFLAGYHLLRTSNWEQSEKIFDLKKLVILHYNHTTRKTETGIWKEFSCNEVKTSEIDSCMTEARQQIANLKYHKERFLRASTELALFGFNYNRKTGDFSYTPTKSSENALKLNADLQKAKEWVKFLLVPLMVAIASTFPSNLLHVIRRISNAIIIIENFQGDFTKSEIFKSGKLLEYLG